MSSSKQAAPIENARQRKQEICADIRRGLPLLLAAAHARITRLTPVSYTI